MAVKVCEDFTCGFCKNFDGCVRDSKEILADVEKEYEKDPKNERLGLELRRAKKHIIELYSEPCNEFVPRYALPETVQQAFMLVAPMSVEHYNLFSWKLETLHQLRLLEEEFDVRLGEDFKSGDSVIGKVKDIRSDGRIIVIKPDGSKSIIKPVQSEELEDE